jgi:hypothetical protein
MAIEVMEHSVFRYSLCPMRHAFDKPPVHPDSKNVKGSPIGL